MKWQTTRQACNKCGHIQVSVHPVVCEYLECSVCHHMNPAHYIEDHDDQTNSEPQSCGCLWFVLGALFFMLIGAAAGLVRYFCDE